VLQALIDAGYQTVSLANRTLGRAENVAKHFGKPVAAITLDELLGALPDADLIVNATSAGLHDDGALDVRWRSAKRTAIVTDLIYVPLVTPFLREAADHGLKIVDGLGMLLHQAVPGFERWFGVRPNVDVELRELIAADIKG
jgi:shikimate dehydrogenase